MQEVVVRIKRENLRKILKAIRTCPKGFQVVVAIPWDMIREIAEKGEGEITLRYSIETAAAFTDHYNMYSGPDPFASYAEVLDWIKENLEACISDIREEFPISVKVEIIE